jgi:hypothetical protein
VTVRRLFDYRLHTGVFNYATNISANLEVQQLGVAGSERYAVQRLLQVHDGPCEYSEYPL